MANNESLNVRLSLSGLAEVEAGIKSLAANIARVTSASLAIGASLAGISVGAGFVDMAKHVLELGGELNNLKTRTGATIPQLMAMQRLLTENGGAAEDAAMLMQHLQKSIVQAAEGGGPLAKAFDDIHLSAAALSKDSPGDQFQKTALAIAAIENPAKKTELAMAIFGRTGAEVVQAFSNVQKVTAAFAADGAFVRVMARSAEMFHETEVAIQRFAMNGTKAMAGFLDQVVPEFTAAFEAIGNIDLTPVGQRIGAFFAVIIESIKNDKFPEMVGLLIEAGFELGAIAARRIMQGVSEFVGSNMVATIAGATANAILTFGTKTAEVVITMIAVLSTAVAAVAEFTYDKLREAFQRVGAFIKNTFAEAVNFLGSEIAKTFTVVNEMLAKMRGLAKPQAFSFTPMAGSSGEIEKSITFMDAFGKYARLTHEIRDQLTAGLDEDLRLSRQILTVAGSITGADKASMTALEKINALIKEQMEKRAAMAEQTKAFSAGTEIDTAAHMKVLLGEELALKSQLVAKEGELGMVESNWALSTMEKYKEKKALLESQKDLLDKIVVNLQKQAALNPEKSGELQNKSLGFQQKSDGVNKQLQGLGPDPNSFGQQFAAVAAKLQSQMGTLATNMAKTFETVFNAAITSISSGITSLIMGTKTWGQAMMQIGNTILTSIISAIVEMGIKLVMAQVLASVTGKAIAASSTALLIPIAAAQAAIWATPATLATISSYGGAAEAAPGFIAAAGGIVEGMSVSGFYKGGYTGDGGKFEAAGIVHRGEFVMPADATRRIGLPALQAMKNGSSFQGKPTGGAAGGGDMHFHYWDDPSRMMNHIKNNPQVQHTLIDLVGKNMHKFR